jgi:hypothetical protein
MRHDAAKTREALQRERQSIEARQGEDPIIEEVLTQVVLPCLDTLLRGPATLVVPDAAHTPEPSGAESVGIPAQES